MDSKELSSVIEMCSKKTISIAKYITSTNDKTLEYGFSPAETKELMNRCRSTIDKYVHQMENVSLHGLTMEKFKSKYDFLENELERDIAEYELFLDSENKKRRSEPKNPLLEEYDKIIAALSNENPETDSEMDSEIITTETTQNYVDPITKKPIENPVRNKICKHIYEKTSMTVLIKMKPRTRCPIVGCGNRNFITLTDLYDDEELSTQLSTLNNK